MDFCENLVSERTEKKIAAERGSLKIKEQDWQKTKEIFALVAEQPADARGDFLREACGADETLRAEIESLLEIYDEPEYVIEKNAFDLSSKFQARNFTDRQFGNYKIIREIGRGGMGAVFLAERSDGEFEQQVALKIVRRTIVDRETEKRFRRERQILASLNHPNVAKLLDGGVSEMGEPFLVMEYVAGEPLLEYARRKNLNVEERLDLFLKICAAVAYAHRNLVVHRDIKPANILVETDGEPKLLDFGLAKILDRDAPDSAATETAFRAFTPAYASPEQIRGANITTASDVYSLGVLLYELLSGEKPFHFENRSYEEISRIIGETNPLRPSSIVRRSLPVEQNENERQKTKPESRIPNPKSLAGDLDNIVLTALRKEPERRYDSVERFADDVRRHLKGLPVAARPNTFRYRAEKFVKRNRLSVVGASLITLSLIGGIVATSWQARRAERRFDDVRRLANSVLFEINPEIERLPGSTRAREILVRRALEYLDSLSSESSGDRQLQSELATAYEKIGDVQGAPRKPNLSDFSGAIASYEKARTIRRRLLEKNPNDAETHRQLAANFAALGLIRWWTNDYEGALKDSGAAIGIYEKLIAEQPDAVSLQIALAELRIDVGQIHAGNNRFTEAYPQLQTALATLENLNRQTSSDREILRLLGKCHTNLGYSFSWDGKQAEAETEMAKALAIYESLVANNPNDAVLRQGLWTAYIQTSSIYEESDDALSRNYAVKALQIAVETAERDRADAQAKQDLAKTYSRLGILSSNLKNYSEAVSNLEKASLILGELEQNEPNNTTYKSDLGKTYARFGEAKYRQHDLQEALDAFEKAAAIFETLYRADAKHLVSLRDLALTRKNIGHIHRDFATAAPTEKRPAHLDAAKENYRQALDILRQLKSQNAFAEYDQPFFEEMQTAAQNAR